MKRDISKKIIFGVCSGIAKSLGIDTTIVRLLFIILALLGFGMPIIIYLVLALIMPVEKGDNHDSDEI